MQEEISGGRISFVTQRAPIDERGRAMYAVSRSILRALIDQLSTADLTVLNTDKSDVTLRQLSMMARLQRDKGMRGDGFEWAVHEALQGGEQSVVEPVAEAMKRMSKKSFASTSHPRSILFGYERAKYLGFLDAAVEDASREAVLLPDSRGHPPAFDKWVTWAAEGAPAEGRLGPRFRKAWKADLFVSDEARHRHVAVTIKSNHRLLEGGRGLRLGIVPSHKNLRPGVSFEHIASGSMGLWVVSLAEPNGFMDLYNDAYASVAEAICTLGRHERGHYWNKQTPMGAEIQEQLEKYPSAPVQEIEAALDDAAQQDLVDVDETLVSVDAPPWLHLGQPSASSIVAPRPSFRKLD